MDNSTFIESLRKAMESDKRYPKTIDDRVWDAMKQVDRRDFVPDISTGLHTVDYDHLEAAIEQLHLLSESQLKIMKSGGEDKAPQQLKEEMIDARGIYIFLSAMALQDSWHWAVSLKDLAYNDRVLHTGSMIGSCSQPSLMAIMIDMLELEEGMKILEIGTGYGYHAAIVSYIIGKKGQLYTVEVDKALAETAHDNLIRHCKQPGIGDLVYFWRRQRSLNERKYSKVTVIHDDGSVGYEKGAPYDGIYLTAGVTENFDPTILVRQLKQEKGVLVYPEEKGNLFKRVYQNGKLSHEVVYKGVSFVPLVGKNS